VGAPCFTNKEQVSPALRHQCAVQRGNGRQQAFIVIATLNCNCEDGATFGGWPLWQVAISPRFGEHCRPLPARMWSERDMHRARALCREIIKDAGDGDGAWQIGEQSITIRVRCTVEEGWPAVVEHQRRLPSIMEAATAFLQEVGARLEQE
jgi:hypothetical protein